MGASSRRPTPIRKDQACGKIASLCLIRGVGANFAAVLAREVFYRSFDNRRQLASYVGITPMPLPKRRHGQADRSGWEPTRANDDDPACLALASLPAWQRPGQMVSRSRRYADRTYAADCDRGDGAKVADCTLALRRRRGGAGHRARDGEL